MEEPQTGFLRTDKPVDPTVCDIAHEEERCQLWSDQFNPIKRLRDDIHRFTRADEEARQLAGGAGADVVQPLRYLEVCAGIGSASVAFEPLGWQCAGMAEIEPKARAFLSQRFPNTPLHHDFRSITPKQIGHVDVVVGGPPCQPFSKQGKRKPDEDPRRELTIELIDLARRVKAPWIVLENVPALVEANGRTTWRRWLNKADESGYSVAWRVFDARQFGLPARRQRLFAVGHSGRPEAAFRCLLEPRRSSFPHPEEAIAKQARGANRVGAFASSARAIALGQGSNAFTEFLPTLCSSRPGRAALMLDEAELRHFTIRELERSMGFPDDWTAFEWNGRPASYQMRAALLGNAFCPPIVHWIGQGIAANAAASL